MAKARLAAGRVAHALHCLKRRGLRFLLAGGCALALAVASATAAPPTAGQILNFKPRQEGVSVSTPTAQEESACKVELVKGARKGSGWLLRDPQGKPLRRFFDSNDDNRIDVWSYYKDGVEVYREIDTNFNGKPDQYRWFNGAGMRWGIDENEDGKIDSWKMISAEEASQELLQALVKKDLARFQALLLSEAELKALELPAAEVNRLRELHKQAAAKFQSAVGKLTNLSEKTTWLELQTGAPQCLPAEQTGAKVDLIRHQRGTIMCDTAGKDDLIQTGEMIQVGAAWRLIDGPTPGPDEQPVGAAAGGQRLPDDPEVQKLFTELNAVDQGAPKPGAAGSEMAAYNLKRANVLEKLIAKDKAENRESWIRQLADCLSAAAQSNDKTAFQRLQRLEEQVVGQMPAGHALAAYVTYREMQADYAEKINKVPFDKLQAEWLDRLAKFVTTYPKADDTADALLQLGWVSEMVGKEVEAKNWYQKLAQNFADNPAAAKARGALKRLDSEGKPLELAGPTLGTNAPFDIAKLNGKVVVVYYWASWNNQCVGDFDKLKQLLAGYGSKGLELVCVNLDASLDEASALLKRTGAPGTHLFTPGGLESKLATDYGVMMLPNLFLVGKDGKVVSRTVQVGGLEAEVQKLLK
jgi:thiol-disulfide isomerase/thioredoxin